MIIFAQFMITQELKQFDMFGNWEMQLVRLIFCIQNKWIIVIPNLDQFNVKHKYYWEFINYI